MKPSPTYVFNLPPEEQVIKRNRTITTYYAQLYQREPYLYKWAGMAAFASFHIGEKLKMWNWESSGIESLSVTCARRNRSLGDDFQIIRIINNNIFAEIGGAHLAFSQMEYHLFKANLLNANKHKLVIEAFERLNHEREQLKLGGHSELNNEIIWNANIQILWHEQSKVVQPLFDKLTRAFSRAMTFFASFDYKINHHPTRRISRSRFILFMLLNGYGIVRSNGLLPELTNLNHRWFWISEDLIKKWKIVESDHDLVAKEINDLAQMEDRSLSL